MKNTFFLFLIYLNGCFIVNSQTKTLSEQLWKHANTCYENFDEETKPETIIDDSKNGYLHIAGTYPTCGCYCESTVGAYKKDNNEYTFLSYSKDLCYFSKKVSSNQPLNEIVSEKLSIKTFLKPSYSPQKDSIASYILTPKIPQKGTVTTFTLEQIPFGIYEPSSNIMVFEQASNISKTNYFHLKDLVLQIENNNFFENLAKKEYQKINSKEMDVLTNYIHTNEYYKTIEEMSSVLAEKYNTYLIYKNLEYDTLIMDWNKKTGKFYIKEKLLIHINPNISFREFLLKSPEWLAAC